MSADADAGDGRDETQNERMDRNWDELLQELRVAQAGTQILTGFLLTIAFQNKFSDLTAFQHGVYLVLVVLACLTTALGLAPVYLHRGLFRQGLKGVVVRFGNAVLRVQLLGIALVLTGTQLLIFDVVASRGAAVGAAAVTAVLVVCIASLPSIVTRRRPGRGANT